MPFVINLQRSRGGAIGTTGLEGGVEASRFIAGSILHSFSICIRRVQRIACNIKQIAM
jgi:hypothetical protein